MCPAYPTYSFASGHPVPDVFERGLSNFYAQGYPDVYTNMLGGWCTSSYEHEVSPWAWQWSGETRTQQVPFTRHPYVATITQPLVQPTYGTGLAPQTFSPVVGRPIPNTDRLEVACPRPIYPPPTWIDMTAWDDEGMSGASDLTPGSVDNDNTDWEEGEDYDEELGAPRRFLPSFLFSPDPEDLPAPFFPPSRDSTPSLCTHTSFSPDARDLPQPYFDSDPPPLISTVNLGSSAPGVIVRTSPRYDSLEPIVRPKDFPPPSSEVSPEFRAGGFGLTVPSGRRGHWGDEMTTGDRTGWGVSKGMRKGMAGERRRVSGPRHHGGRLDLTWGR